MLAQLLLKQQRQRNEAAAEAAQQCLDDKWLQEGMRRQAYRSLLSSASTDERSHIDMSRGLSTVFPNRRCDFLCSDLKKKPNDVLGRLAMEEEQKRRAQRPQIRRERPCSAASPSYHHQGQDIFGSSLSMEGQLGHCRSAPPFCW